jgi:hypothetical protein
MTIFSGAFTMNMASFHFHPSDTTGAAHEKKAASQIYLTMAA